MTKQIAIFAAGCFWGVEEQFRTRPGIIETQVGYTGGHTPTPTYKQVCDGITGHAEAVRLIFEPHHVTYQELLDIFFASHDATQLNRQGPDTGSQYRSAIFSTSLAQADLAQKAIDRRPGIVTTLHHAQDWWPAEAYHQQHILKQGGGTCR